MELRDGVEEEAACAPSAQAAALEACRLRTLGISFCAFPSTRFHPRCKTLYVCLLCVEARFQRRDAFAELAFLSCTLRAACLTVRGGACRRCVREM